MSSISGGSGGPESVASSVGSRTSCRPNTGNLGAGANHIFQLKSCFEPDNIDRWNRTERNIQMDETIVTHDITGYADHYHKHPRHLLATTDGWITVDKTRCKYTGLTADKLSRRINKDRTLRKRERGKRKQMMQQANQMYRQDMVAAFICATRNPGIKHKGAKRQGAKAVKS